MRSANLDMDAEAVVPVATRKQRVWDAPTRIMDWLLVAFLGACWWTGTHNQLDYHLYSGYVTFKGGRHLAHLHYQWFQYLLVVIGLHLVAVAFYYVYKRQNLVAPMISGSRTVSEVAEEDLE